MSRRMSCAITVDAVRARTKTETRRHVGSWRTLTTGDRLTLIEKGMGLKKGDRQPLSRSGEPYSVANCPGCALAYRREVVRRAELGTFGHPAWEQLEMEYAR